VRQLASDLLLLCAVIILLPVALVMVAMVTSGVAAAVKDHGRRRAMRDLEAMLTDPPRCGLGHGHSGKCATSPSSGLAGGQLLAMEGPCGNRVSS
jgi:hypothetical protein